MTRRKRRFSRIVLPVALALAALAVLLYFVLFYGKTYSARDFGITEQPSGSDFNGNGVDDYADFVAGARTDAENHPAYNGAYYQEGYPPDNIGVCTDVIWRGFRAAGYSLRNMVDRDIAYRPSAYPDGGHPDSAIDFRRVKNLHVFFEAYGTPLSTDPHDTDQWQGGDLVIFGNDKHIGMVSDKRDARGVCYILHNGGQRNREENYLSSLSRMEIIAHYRFNPSQLPEEIRAAWE